MDTLRKLEVLKEFCVDDAEFEQILEKVLDAKLSQQRQRLERYERDLRDFEQRFGLDSTLFYQRFESGELGDDLDLCEWAGIVELRNDLVEKIRLVESAV